VLATMNLYTWTTIYYEISVSQMTTDMFPFISNDFVSRIT
jgi:hypothetical protein